MIEYDIGASLSLSLSLTVSLSPSLPLSLSLSHLHTNQEVKKKYNVAKRNEKVIQENLKVETQFRNTF